MVRESSLCPVTSKVKEKPETCPAEKDGGELAIDVEGELV